MSRPPKPTALLEHEKGTLYSDQRDRTAYEPKPQKEIIPRCPQRFGKNEKRVWKQIGDVLKNYGLFTAANAIHLELLATAWAQYIDISEKLSENPAIVMKKKDGGAMFNPYFSAQHKIGQLVDKYAQTLGLSSIQMAKIGSLMLKAKKEKSEMEDLLD